jgi:hypothetical protein
MSALGRRRRVARDRPAGGGATRVARRGAWGLARLIMLVASVVAGILVLGIVLVLLEANRSNTIVDAVLDVAKFLAGPFDDIFKLDTHKATIGVNWGIAAAVYFLVGSLIARLLRR